MVSCLLSVNSMLRIRLQRIGKKKQAFFRLVLLEHTSKPQGAYLELLGNYDPHANKINANGERITYWVSKGAKITPTVHNLLIGAGVIQGEKVRFWKPKKKEQSATPTAPTSAPVA